MPQPRTVAHDRIAAALPRRGARCSRALLGAIVVSALGGAAATALVHPVVGATGGHRAVAVAPTRPLGAARPERAGPDARAAFARRPVRIEDAAPTF